MIPPFKLNSLMRPLLGGYDPGQSPTPVDSALDRCSTPIGLRMLTRILRLHYVLLGERPLALDECLPWTGDKEVLG